jgi:hypothetical protein
MLVPIYDIFSGRIDDAIWIEAAEHLVNANDRMAKIAEEKPGPYFVFCLESHAVCSSIDTSSQEQRNREIRMNRKEQGCFETPWPSDRPRD